MTGAGLEWRIQARDDGFCIGVADCGYVPVYWLLCFSCGDEADGSPPCWDYWDVDNHSARDSATEPLPQDLVQASV